jgi:hypothetical protein
LLSRTPLVLRLLLRRRLDMLVRQLRRLLQRQPMLLGVVLVRK